MRKLLSFVLALALVASVFVGVTIANAEPAVVGYKVTALKDLISASDGSAASYNRVNAGLTEADVVWDDASTGDGTANTTKTGKITMSYTFYNVSAENDARIQLKLYAGNRLKNGASAVEGWDGVGGAIGDGYRVVSAGKALVVELEYPVYRFTDNAIVFAQSTSKYNDVEGYAPISTAYLRFDINILKAGDSVIIAAEAGDKLYSIPAKAGDFEWATVTELPTIEQEPDPVGVKFEVTETLKNAYGYFHKDKIYTADDVKDGKLTVSYDFYNPTDSAVRVNLWIQNGWANIVDKIPTSRVEAELAPQSKQTLTLELPVNADNKVVIDNATTAELSALRLRVQFDDLDESDKAAGTCFIVAAPEGDAIYSLAGGTYFVKEGTAHSGAVKQSVVTELPAVSEVTPTPTPEPTPTPIPVKKLENLNAEAGLVGGWGNIHGGSVELVQPGANKTGNAVKAIIAGKYQSLGYDFGPAIIQDAEQGYAGAGAGIYTIKFWAKAEDGNEGKYMMYLNSVCHLNKTQVADLNLGLEETENTYRPIGTIELYDEWEEYELEFEITETYINMIYALAKSDHANASKAYQLMLRFDGSPATCAYGEDEYFNYYVDELSITCPEVGDTSKTPTGVVFEATTDANISYIVTSGDGGAANASEAKNGEITKVLYLQNLSDEDMAVQFTLQARVELDGSATWADPDDCAPEAWEIPAGETVKMEFTFPVNEDGTVTVKGVDVPVGKLFYRLNFNPADFAEGTKFVIYGDETQVALFNGATKTGWSKTYTYDAIPVGSGDVAPVALIATVAVAFVALAVVVAKKRRED